MDTKEDSFETYIKELLHVRILTGRISQFLLPLLFLIGLMSNILAMAVFAANYRQMVRSHIYMLFLCMSDVISLCCKVWYIMAPVLRLYIPSWKTSILNYNYGQVSCMIVNFWYFFQSIFLSFLILICIDRLWCVFWPLSHYLSSKRSKPLICVMVVIFINSSLLLPIYPFLQAGLYMNETKSYVCYLTQRDNTHRLWLFLTRRVFGNGLIYFPVLILLNICLIVKLVDVFQKQIRNKNKTPNNRNKLTAKNFKKAIQTVMMVGFFFLCNLPSIFFSVWHFVVNIRIPFKNESERLSYFILYYEKYQSFSLLISLLPSMIYSYFSSRDAKFFAPQLQIWFLPRRFRRYFGMKDNSTRRMEQP